MLITLVCRRDPVLILFKSNTPSKVATTPVTKQMSAYYLKKERTKDTIDRNHQIDNFANGFLSLHIWCGLALAKTLWESMLILDQIKYLYRWGPKCEEKNGNF